MSDIREAIKAAIEEHNEPEKIEQPAEVIQEPLKVEPEVVAKEVKETKEPLPSEPENIEQPVQEEIVQEEQPVKPPRALAAHLKAKWSDIDPDIKKEFVRLEENSFKGVSALQEDAKVGRSLKSIIEPYTPLIAAAGGTPETVVSNLLRTAAILRTGTPYEKQQAVYGIIQEYGIDIGNVQYQAPDPVMTRVQQLEQQLLQTKQQQEQQSELERVNAVNNFLEETDSNGNLKYPLDESLANPFYYEVLAVKETNPNAKYRDVLEKAYENLSWKVPEIRQAKLAQQQSEAEAKRKEKEAAEVAKKKGAAVSIKGTTSPSLGDNFAELPLREQLKRQVYSEPKRI